MTENSSPIATGVTPERLVNLYRWNMGLTILHFGQAAFVLFLTNDFALGVLKSLPDGPPGTSELATSKIFDVRVGWVIALFLALAGIDHLLTATFARKTYEKDLMGGINRFRWIEYSISATLMIIVISMYWGVVNVNALIAIAGANIVMILFGWLQERMNPPGRTSTTMLPFWFGVVAGITPWLAMGINLFFITDAPGAIYAILFVQAIFFFCFGLNQWLQYRGAGRWANYAHGEKTYLVLSLGAKSLLAWQIFAVSLVA